MTAGPAQGEATRLVLGQLQTIRRRVDELQRRSTLDLTLRALQDEIATYLVKNAAALLDLAIEKATAEQCKECSGYGRVSVQYACDDIKIERCTHCSGTGIAKVSS